MTNKDSRHNLAHMSWFIPFFFLICWAPLGIVLAVLKIVDQQAEKKEMAARRQWMDQLNGQTAPGFGYAGAPGRQNGTAAPPPFRAGAAPRQTAAGRRTASFNRDQAITIILIVAGAIAIIGGLPMLFTGVEFLSYGWLDRYTLLEYVLPGLCQVAGGAAMAFLASRRLKSGRLERLMVNITGQRDNITLKELSEASGLPRQKVQDLVEDAIEHGSFGPSAYIDMRTRTLVVRGPAPEPAPKPEKKKTSKKKADTDAETYQAILQELHDINEAIPGEEMSAKISQLEHISARIFDLAQKDPGKRPQLDRFMDYYLPTARKLLRTYATLDSQGIEGDNITETKTTIENSMDLLVQAFEAQLDKLFESDALDISGDVAALQGMMNLDGLTESDFGPAAPAPGRIDPMS